MKKVLSVLVAVLLIAVACVPAFAADNSAVLEASATEAKVGDIVTVSFKVGGGLSGLKATLEYNRECYEYVAGSAEATNLFTTEINDTEAGKLTVACAADTAKDAGVVFTAKFKVLKAGGTMIASVEDAIDGTDASVTVAGSELSIKVVDGGAAETTTAAETTAAAPTTNKENPKTGGKLYTASAVTAAVLAAAVVVTMKKKNED